MRIIDEFSLDIIKTLEKRGERDLNSFILGIIFIPFIGATVAAFFYWRYLHQNGVSRNPEQWGQMGDFFGGILNPTLAFFSLLALCYTLALQFVQSRKTAQFNAIQNFESFLLELIRLHRDNLNSIDLWNKETKKETRGRDCILVFLRWIAKNHHELTHDDLPSTERLQLAYKKFYEDDQKKVEIGHYFRNLYHIFKFIDESKIIGDADKERYAKLVRAQLSTPELALLFFNGLSSKGTNFKRYIEKYSILLDLTSRDLKIRGISDIEIRKMYEESAFEDKD